MDQTVPLSAVTPSASAPHLAVVMRRTTDLVPYTKNARTHSDAQIEVICKSLKEFGWTNPVLIDGQAGVIAGHGRLKAAQKLGMSEVPCIVLDHMTDAQRRAYVLADNQTALLAGWDDELLALELGDLNEMGFDLSSIGFDTKELDALLGENARSPGFTDPDDTPDTPTNPVARTGDVWLLGKHVLVCGDCTKAEDVRLAMRGAAPHLMVTDPPYGVNYDSAWREEAMPEKNTPNGARGKVENDDRKDWREAWGHFTGEVAYCWHAGLHANSTQVAFESCGFGLRAQIIWAKHQHVIGRGHYHVQHEPCFYMVRGGATGHWNGDRKQNTLWQIDKPQKSETGHSTQKPVECMKRPIENNSKAGDAVYDPFVGSGTTIIAAEMTGRVCHAIELNPAYIDVAIQRWQAFTGRIAVLDAGQRTFDAVKAERVEGYNARDDLSKSVDAAYEAIRDRQEAGGPGYVPPTADAPKRRGRPPKAVAAE